MIGIEKRARIESVIYLKRYDWKSLTTQQMLNVLKVIHESK